MTQHHIKRTDREWLDLIHDCYGSGLTIRTWCAQHDITVKSFYYHTRQLRQKGYAFPQRASLITQKKQEVVCIGISDDTVSGISMHNHSSTGASDTPAACVNFCGIHIEISNHAAQDAVINIFRALQQLC